MYCGLQERRQFVCFLLTTLVEIVYIPANILGLNDYHNSIALELYNWAHLMFSIILQIAFWRKWMTTSTALYIFFIGIVLKLSTESLYELFTFGPSSSHILGNFNIIMILAAVAVAVRIKKLAYIITGLLTIDLSIFCYIGDNDYVTSVMRVFFVGYMLIIFVLLFDSRDSTKGLRLPNNITKEQQRAIDMLINLNESNVGKVYSLMSHLNEMQQEELIAKVKDHIMEEQVETLNFLSICPELTKSEIEICKLIIRDKSLKEICTILGKSKSNITCQRTHIRRKLGLQKNEDLKMALVSKVNKAENK